MDHHVPRAITNGLRFRSIEVITAQEDNAHEHDDSTLLDRAYELERVLFTRDDDLLIEAARRQRETISFYGVIYAHQLRVSIRQCIDDLELLATAGQPDDVIDQVIFFPL
jgi:predicted nuclease of predicted toxin-antitoxin system